MKPQSTLLTLASVWEISVLVSTDGLSVALYDTISLCAVQKCSCMSTLSVDIYFPLNTFAVQAMQICIMARHPGDAGVSNNTIYCRQSRNYELETSLVHLHMFLYHGQTHTHTHTHTHFEQSALLIADGLTWKESCMSVRFCGVLYTELITL